MGKMKAEVREAGLIIARESLEPLHHAFPHSREMSMLVIKVRWVLRMRRRRSFIVG